MIRVYDESMTEKQIEAYNIPHCIKIETNAFAKVTKDINSESVRCIGTVNATWRRAY